MRNPFKNESDQNYTSRSILFKKSLYIEIAFNFTKEIPVKPNGIKKKVHLKIDITFNSIYEIPLKMNRT